MGKTGWTTVALKNALVARLDAFIEGNEWGYSNRAEVVTAALRTFLEDEPPLTRSDLERALRAVASLKPETPAALLEALLRELDMKVR